MSRPELFCDAAFNLLAGLTAIPISLNCHHYGALKMTYPLSTNSELGLTKDCPEVSRGGVSSRRG